MLFDKVTTNFLPGSQLETLPKEWLIPQPTRLIVKGGSYRSYLMNSKMSFRKSSRQLCHLGALLIITSRCYPELPHLHVHRTVESGKNVTFFEQLFCFYQLVLVVWNTLGAKFKLSFISRVEQNCHFLWQWSKKIALNPFGGTLGGNGGPGKSFLRSRVPWACTARLFLLDLRATCTVFSGVRHVCHDNDGSFGDADPGIPG